MRLMWALEEAKYDYWTGNLPEAIKKLRVLDEFVIEEPPLDSEEYKNGERKSATPDDKQEEAECKFEGEDDVVADVATERDEYGYLIR